MSVYTAGIIQMDSTADLNGNLERIEFFAAQAAGLGAMLISMPETVNIIAPDPARHAEPIPGPTTERLAALARRHGLWIHGGSLWEKNGKKPWNTTVMIGPEGEVAAKYRKIHLFDIEVEGGPSFMESDSISPGRELVVIDSPFGRLGFTICYDLRFPELFRLLALAGAEVIFVPACFTEVTGRAHWESLLRARAIENGCYVLAAAQCGRKPRYLAHGHSLAINPWGEIIAGRQASEGLSLAKIDLEEVKAARRQIPVLANRRTDVYDLKVVF